MEQRDDKMAKRIFVGRKTKKLMAATLVAAGKHRTIVDEYEVHFLVYKTNGASERIESPRYDST